MELDDAYANVPHIPGGAQYPARWMVAAETFRARLSNARRAELGRPYGDSARQVFDLFHPTGTARGLCVFVHGGYWLRFDRSYWSHLAAGPLARGWAVMMPSYDLCPEVRIADITRQTAQAVCVLAARNEGPIALVGHSAGGHLVARMAVPGVLPGDVAEPRHANLTGLGSAAASADLDERTIRPRHGGGQGREPGFDAALACCGHRLGWGERAASISGSGPMAGRGVERRP